jgi:hypothetical protein
MRIGFRAVDGVQILFAVSDSPTSPRLVLTKSLAGAPVGLQRVWPRLVRTAHALRVNRVQPGRHPGQYRRSRTQAQGAVGFG